MEWGGFANSCALLATCGSSNNACNIHTATIPLNAPADHSAAVPGNHVQFSLSSSVKGNCPLTPDFEGVWSTSDPVNTAISNQGLAMCVNATPTPATISNSSKVREVVAYPPSTLACK
jgi:hypothetical protein